MQYNNLFIIAKADEQCTINLKEFNIDDFTAIQINEFKFNRIENNVRLWVRMLTKSHLLVTVGDWQEDKNLQIIVDIARRLDIPVVPQSNFKKYVEQQNA